MLTKLKSKKLLDRTSSLDEDLSNYSESRSSSSDRVHLQLNRAKFKSPTDKKQIKLDKSIENPEAYSPVGVKDEDTGSH